MYVYVSETLLYLCFSLVAGTVILTFVPNLKKPELHVPSSVIFYCVAGIGLLSLVPVIKNTLLLAGFAQMSFWEVFPDVLQDLAFGRAWLWILLMCTALLGLLAWKDLQEHVWVNVSAAILLTGMIVSYGWASHAAGQSETWGFWAQSLHLLAVSAWVGVMLVAGWFSKQTDHWRAFLQWFHPLSIICVLLTVGSGLVMMKYIVPNYLDSWVINYGQALLIKHLLIIPLLAFGLINGFLIRRQLQTKPEFDTRRWLKAESLIVLLIFAVTAFMGMQTPPHDDPERAEPLTPSPMYRLFHPDTVSADKPIHLIVNGPGMILAAISLLLILIMLYLPKKNAPWAAATVGLLSAFAGYMAFMVSVH